MRLLSVRPFGRGVRIIGGSIGGGFVTFDNEDGSSTTPIAIPDGVLVWVDNGDSTWSVG